MRPGDKEAPFTDKVVVDARSCEQQQSPEQKYMCVCVCVYVFGVTLLTQGKKNLSK